MSRVIDSFHMNRRCFNTVVRSTNISTGPGGSNKVIVEMIKISFLFRVCILRVVFNSFRKIQFWEFVSSRRMVCGILMRGETSCECLSTFYFNKIKYVRLCILDVLTYFELFGILRMNWDNEGVSMSRKWLSQCDVCVCSSWRNLDSICANKTR